MSANPYDSFTYEGYSGVSIPSDWSIVNSIVSVSEEVYVATEIDSQLALKATVAEVSSKQPLLSTASSNGVALIESNVVKNLSVTPPLVMTQHVLDGLDADFRIDLSVKTGYRWDSHIELQELADEGWYSIGFQKGGGTFNTITIRAAYKSIHEFIQCNSAKLFNKHVIKPVMALQYGSTTDFAPIIEKARWKYKGVYDSSVLQLYLRLERDDSYTCNFHASSKSTEGIPTEEDGAEFVNLDFVPDALVPSVDIVGDWENYTSTEELVFVFDD